MTDVIGDLLPLALVIALSPVPMIATVLMLLSPRAAERITLGFLLGTVSGILIAVTIFVILSEFIPESDPEGPASFVGMTKIALGLVLLYLGVRKWQGRPVGDETAKMPGWMASVEGASPLGAFTMGFMLVVINPKNLLLSASAGVTIGPAELATAATAMAIIVFTILASVSVWAPVIAYRVAPQQFEGSLESSRAWLVQNSQAMMAAVLVVIGANVVGQGISTF